MFWGIVGGIFGALALLVLGALLLELKIIFQKKENSEPSVYIRLLWWDFLKEDAPQSGLGKKLQDILGISGAKKGKNTSKDSPLQTVKFVAENLKILVSQLRRLLSKCAIRRLKLRIVCAGEDPAETAMEYGAVSSVVYGLAGYLAATCRMKEKTADIQIGCDYNSTKWEFSYDIVLAVRMFRIVRAFLALAFENVKRRNDG